MIKIKLETNFAIFFSETISKTIYLKRQKPKSFTFTLDQGWATRRRPHKRPVRYPRARKCPRKMI